ncbi:chaperonin GroES [Candidatus Kryptonium thompsonii]|jgi:chaperonin GroES|uniref:Co-chaperonin GroES n=1 Tax=Candidatus Kryptonium thompsonii TaxID=1633631 RepID=A0A0P1LC24_9BACT|nr:co-chaperone GroES [Candidatus Kryptonium thompsoni]CUS77432.1 chaperonin GroES [Candidatus Kryptonium thompsoni]CUS78761.1 chaperonin GroES [Candidatus Kryptonium thompsoni]CUS86343.1 chaperonin GroES [Candidatus Kryptonium thompsoni]CUS86432.1 chaperonin GroES [Candidatus Kryptonium thompsoni]CUS88202.1 chaperonin GroES [Candidatus Kryptonium thompsoni]
MKIKPLDDRILIEPLEEVESKTSSGIIIPDTAKEKPRVGIVIAVGTDEDLQSKIKVGDKVLFAKYGGEEIEMNGKEYRIVSRSDILAVIED